MTLVLERKGLFKADWGFMLYQKDRWELIFFDMKLKTAYLAQAEASYILRVAKGQLKQLSKNKTNLICFGGTFDPPHLAHFKMLHEVMMQLNESTSLVIPSGISWQKANVTSSPQRLEMLNLAMDFDRQQCRTTSDSKSIAIFNVDIERATPTYTIDTVNALVTHFSDCHLLWLIGMDQFLNFHTWKQWQGILEHVTLLVMNRGGVVSEKNSVDPAFNTYVQKNTTNLAELEQSSRAFKAGQIVFLATSFVEISSSQIRNLFAQKGCISARELAGSYLAPSVVEYILSNNLYQSV